MIKPVALCIEDPDSTDAGRRYLRCVAIEGSSPGLALAADGTALWKDGEDVACELWVAGDGRLALLRPLGAPPLTLRRGGRHLDVPHDKPVFVLDGDRLELDMRNLLVHVHGLAPSVTAPSFLPSSEASAGGRVRAAVAAMALGAAVAAGAFGGSANANPPKDEPVEVRDFPPKVISPNPKELPGPGGSGYHRAPPESGDGTAEETDPEEAGEAQQPEKGGKAKLPKKKTKPKKAPVKK